MEFYPPSNHLQDLGTQPCLNQQQGSGSLPNVSNTFTNVSDISNLPLLPTKALAMGHLLWRRYCRRSGIKDLIPATCSLCKYTCQVVVCMILTSKKCLGLDIWPKFPQKAKSTQSKVRSTWNIEAIWRLKGIRKLDCPLALTGKEAKHVHALLFRD